MQVTGTQTLKIYLEEREIDHVFNTRFFQLTKFKNDYFIKDGIVKEECDRHPRDYVEDIREATELDYVCEKLFELIRKQK